MCTVLLRFRPGARWPVLLGAIRDEFADRPWDPPGEHWPGEWAGLIGGRDRQAGGTWLAVDPSASRPAVAALLNGVRRPLPADGQTRPTRGTLALEVLTTGRLPEVGADVGADPSYDGFHLVRATAEEVRVWSWDGEVLTEQALEAGDHVIVNLGVDTPEDPLVPHFRPLLSALPSPALEPGAPSLTAWEPWTDFLAGDGLDPADPRALIVRRAVGDRIYASTSAALVALSADALRYDFCPAPTDPATWGAVTPAIRR